MQRTRIRAPTSMPHRLYARTPLCTPAALLARVRALLRFSPFHEHPDPVRLFFSTPSISSTGGVQAWLRALLHSEFTPLSSPTIISTIILLLPRFILTSTHPLLQPPTFRSHLDYIITLLNPPIFARQNALGPVQLPPLVPELSPLLPLMTSLLTCQTPSPPLFTLFCPPFGLSYFTNTFFTAFYTLPHLNITQKSAP